MQDRLIEKPSREGLNQSLERKFIMNALRSSLTATAFSAVVLSYAALAAGADFRRVAPGGGSFFSTARWSPVGVPGATDRAIFDLSSVYAVSFGASPGSTVVNQRLRIGNDDVTFDLDGRLYSLTSTSSTSLSMGGGTHMLPGGDGIGELRIIDGSLRAVTAIVGDGSSIFNRFGSGTFEVSSGATFSSPGSLLVGAGTPGTFRIDSGGVANTFLATVGYDAVGTAIVTGANSTWNSDALDVDNGTLNIQSGGVVKTTDLSGSYIGVTPGKTGVVNVSGLGSEWDSFGPLTIGHGGYGSLHISNQGFVDGHSGPHVLGHSSGSTGTVTVDGIGSRWNASPTLQVGNMGSGSLAVTNGAIVSALAMSIGAHPIGTGYVSVSGGGALLETNSGLFVGGGEFAEGGAGTLDITSGGRTFVNFSGATKVWGPGTINLNGGRLETGRLELLGGTFNWTAGTLSLFSDLSIEPTGLFGGALALDSDRHLEVSRLLVGQNGDGILTAEPNTMVSAYGLLIGGTAGGDAHFNGSVLTTSNDVVFGDEAGSEGTATYENLALWNHSTGDPNTPFVVGDAGVGTLNILSDSDVLLMDQTLPILGNEATGHGTINLDGDGSELFVSSQDLSVGRLGEGRLNITDGGVLTAAAKNVVVAELGSGRGAIHITGADSTLRAPSVYVGYLGAGMLDIDDAGYLEASFEIVLALNAGSTATATVDGAGSRLAAIGDAALIIGGGGDASLTVSGGAIADAHEVIIGDGLSAVGNVLVTGTGSQLDGREEMRVGYNGIANLTLADGGIASAPLIEINSQSSVHGNGTLLGDVTNFGLVSPGTSTGALHLDGAYLQADNGVLRIELASTLSFDQLLVTGMASLAGTLDVALLGGFTPTAGQSFDIIDWGSLDGTFSALNLPVLSGGLSWNTSQLYTMGALSVDTPFSADFDGDGDVDADDLDEWQAAYGVSAVADADSDGDSDGRDFLEWQRQFGSGIPSVSAISSVPEPSGLALLSLVGCGLALVRQRRPVVHGHWSSTNPIEI